MKKKTLFKTLQKAGLYLSIVLISTNSAFAQWDGSPINTYTTTSNVGIGLGPVSDAKLSIDNPAYMVNTPHSVPAIKIQRTTYETSGVVGSDGGNIFELWQQIYDPSGSPTSNAISFVINGHGEVGIGKSTASSSLDVGGDIHGDYNLTIGSNGTINGNLTVGSYVVVGPASLTSTSTPGTDYDLYVQHGILTEKLKVATYGSSDWADFVFNKNYKLRSIKDVSDYIKTNKHLPDVPSAQEVAKDGIDVAKMDAKLLQKIEELTLYMIDLKKENEELRNEINNLKKSDK